MVERQESRGGPERVQVSENVLITAETLLSDNQSVRAKELSLAWEKNHHEGNLWAIVTCGDARTSSPVSSDKSITIRSIATAGTKEKRIFASPGVKGTVVMSHIDGDTVRAGLRPTGCGGLGAKEESLNGNGEKGAIEGIGYYIENRIEHPDPVLQAFISAREIRNTTGKPSLAVIQDHRTGRIYPFAAFGEDYQVVAKELDGIELAEYAPQKLYADGLPVLQASIIPSIFQEVLQSSAEQVEDMLRKYPNLREMLKVQNPRVVAISSKLPSMKIRYPETMDFPGLAFKLFLPREKEGPGKIEIPPTAQREIIGQAQYPLEHAAENFGQADKPFSKTNRVFIETSSIDVSKALADELSRKDWMQKWLLLPDHKILVAQNIEGVSNIIEEV